MNSKHKKTGEGNPISLSHLSPSVPCPPRVTGHSRHVWASYAESVGSDKKMMAPIMPLICSASYGSRMLLHKLFHLERSLMQMFYAFVTIKIANSE